MAETIKVRREGQIVKVLLNRPEAYNAALIGLINERAGGEGALGKRREGERAQAPAAEEALPPVAGGSDEGAREGA